MKTVKTYLLSIIGSLVLLTVVYYLNDTTPVPTPSPNQNLYSPVEASAFVNQLEKLGYFKYVDRRYLKKVKKYFTEAYDPNNEILGPYNDSTNTPLDCKSYFCDGEDIFEQDGIIELLEELQPTFDKIGFKLKVSNHIEGWDDKNDWLNHSITLNQTNYVLFKEFKEYGWSEAPLRIAHALNLELEKQQIEEVIYLASNGHDGRLIFLTKEQFSYIDSIYTNPQWKPLELKEWARVMQVKL